MAALAALCIAASSDAKTLIVWDAVANVTYTNGDDPMLATRTYVSAVTAIMDRFGASYVVCPASNVRTTWANGGYLRHNEGTAGAYTETFDAVIHVGYNGSTNSRFAAGVCQPDSILRNASPAVPQLILLEDNLVSVAPLAFDHATARPTGIAANGYITPGSGSGNHEGEGTTFLKIGPEQWFDAIYGSSLVKSTTATSNGLRVLLGSGMNSVFNTIERTGNMTTNPDSVGRAGADTMKVWVHQNLNGTGVKTIMATAFSAMAEDSISSGIPVTPPGINWPVLLCSMAALDSAANGRVLGTAKRPGIGFVITHAGTRAARNNPRGFFSADSNFVKQSCDSLASYGLPVVIAADPESLAVNAGDIAIWKRIGSARWTPFSTRAVSDTSSLGASLNSTTLSPVDVWGRWRNRAFYGDSLRHTVNGVDTSLTAGLVSSRSNLASLVGGERLSGMLIAPEWDYSPRQMRSGLNHGSLDSLMWAVRKSGANAIVVNTQGRDSDPNYRTANPTGFLASERTHTIQTSSLKGAKVKLLGFSVFPVHGSSKFIAPSPTDTLPPYCDVGCPGMNVAVAYESRFWNGYFPVLGGRDSGSSPYDGLGSPAVGVYSGVKDLLYGHNRASVCVLPANLFGGGGADYGFGHTNTPQVYPTRTGWLIMKHLANVARAANKLAGRTIIVLQYPEDIEP